MTATLSIGGTVYGGWTEVSVMRTIEAAAGTFSLSVSERWPGQETPRQILPGARAALALNGDTVISGFVDAVAPSYDAESHDVRIEGRDAAGDLVDCSAETSPGEWLDARIDEIARALAAPYGVPVTAAAPAGEPFRKFRIEEGETVWEAIERGCRMRALLAASDGKGGLALFRPPGSRAAVALERGVNILSASMTADHRDRYAHYVVLAQQAGNDFLDPGQTAHIRAEAADPGVRASRRLILLAEQGTDLAGAQERADWEASVRAARSRRATVRVAGWRERPGGALWRPNTVTRVRDDLLGLDRDMLIVTVRQSISEADGTVTDLTLALADAYRPEPEPEPEDDPSGFWR